MFSFTSTIRFSEVDMNRKLSLSSIVNYFQDCSTFQSEAIGLGFDYLANIHRVWLMSAWQIVIYRLPSFGETIQIGTWAHSFDALYGNRNFVLIDESGQTIVAANSVWVFADTETGRPVKIRPEDLAGYETAPPFPMEYAGRKIAIPSDSEQSPPFQITQSYMDYNRHVNNGQYIRMAESYLPENFTVGEFRADYRKSSYLGDMIYPHRSLSDTTCTIVLADADGKPYTTVQFLKK